MSKLGIDIEAKFSNLDKLKSEFENKWKDTEAEIKLKVSDDSLSDIKSKIKNVFGEDGLKVKLDTSSATEKLNKLTTSFNKLKTDLSNDLKIDLKLDGSSTRVLDAMSKGGKSTGNVLESMGRDAEELKTRLNETSGILEKVTSTQKVGADGTATNIQKITKEYEGLGKVTQTFTNGQLNQTQVIENQKSALRDIVSVQKEINSLNKQSIGADDKTKKIYQDRISALKEYQSELKRSYKEASGQNADDSWSLKNVESIGKMQSQLKEVSVAKQQALAYDRETESMLKRLIDLRNQEASLGLKAYSALEKGSNQEAIALTKQQANMTVEAKALETKLNAQNRLNDSQKKSLDVLRQEHQFALNLAEAKTKDTAKAEAQKAAYTELKSSLKDIYNTQKQIADLDGKKQANTIESKEEFKLEGLKKQLEVQKQIYSEQKKQADNNGTLSSKTKELLAAQEKQQSVAIKNRTEQSKAKAEVEQVANAYRKLEDSLKRQQSLHKQLSTSGKDQSKVILKDVEAEKKHQAEIEETISLLKKKQSVETTASDKKIADLKEETALSEQSARQQQKAYQTDEFRNSAQNAMLFNPMQMYNTAKQGFMTAYRTVSEVDAMITDIAKVADVPDEVMGQFAKDIYRQAANVGKSADEYAESVARWVTSGKTLSEADALSQTSVMGSFVGNIGEADMVDYMSVPLNAFKKDMLEANDIINAMNEVSNNNAIEMDHLGKAYQRSAASVSQSGTSFSELTGLITGAQEATREGGEKIGTALKSTSLNFAKIASQTTDMDADRYKWFKKNGVALKDENNQLRSTYDILKDISGQWDSWSSLTQNEALLYASGKHHATTLAGMLSNWQTVEKAAGEAQGEVNRVIKTEGSAFDEFTKQKDSVQYKTAQVKASFQEIINTVTGGRDGINSVLDIANKLLQKGNELAQNEGIMSFAKSIVKAIGALTALSAGVMIFSKLAIGARALGSGLSALVRVGKSLGMVFSAVKNFGLLSGAKGLLGAAGAKGATGLASAIMGTALPAVGGLITILSVLDMMGVPVWSTLGKAVKGFGDKVEDVLNPIGSFERETKKLEKRTEKLNKSLENNQLHNGTTGRIQEQIVANDKLIKSIEKRQKKEQKSEEQRAKQTGKKPKEVRPYLTNDEYASVKKSVNGLAEQMGWDVEIRLNDYEHVKAQLEELQRLKNALNKEELDKFMKDMNKLGKSKEDSADKKQQVKGDLQKKKNVAESNLAKKGETQEYYDLRRKELAEINNKLADDNAVYQDAAWKNYEEAEKKRIESYQTQTSKMAQNIINGEVKQNFHTQDFDMQKQTIVGGASNLKKEKGVISELQGLNKKIKAEGKLTEEELTKVQEMFADTEGIENLSTDTAKWDSEFGEGFTDKVMGSASSKIKSTQKNMADLKRELKELGEVAGISEADMKKYMDGMEKGGQAAIDILKDTDYGATLLGVGPTFLAEFGDSWADQLTSLQTQLDEAMNAGGEGKEKVIKYDLITEMGTVNTDIIDDVLKLPPEIQTHYKLIDESGDVDLNSTINLLDKIDSMKGQEVDVSFKTDVGKIDNIKDALELWEDAKKAGEQGEKEFFMKFGIKFDDEGSDKVDEVEKKADKKSTKTVDVEVKGDEKVDKVDEKGKKPTKKNVDVNVKGGEKVDEVDKKGKENVTKPIDVAVRDENANEKVRAFQEKLAGIDKQKVEGKITAEDAEFQKKMADYDYRISIASTKKAKAKLEADKSNFDNNYRVMQAQLSNPGSGTATLHLQKGAGFDATIAEATRTRKMSVIMEIIKTGASVSKNMAAPMSVAIASPTATANASPSVGIGQSFSAGINTAGASTAYSTSSNNNQRVSEDVWRYWSKELYKGLPLEKSANALSNELKKANDNYAKMQTIYKKQIALINKQIAHEQSMRSSYTSELNSVIGKLKKEGFKFNGNKEITNPTRAKAFKGDKASDVETLLNKYKDVFSQINSINTKIDNLRQEKWDVEQEVKDAKVKQELEKIEKRLKQTQAILTAVKNNLDILSQKNDFISDQDTKLKLIVTEEGMNAAIGDAKKLMNEFNALAKMKITNAENAEQMQSELESLKDSILDNADAAIEYRNALNEIQVERLINDFEKFNKSISKNLEYLTNNVENLKEGLLSGSDFSTLKSATFDKLFYQEKSAIEKQYEERLRLEAELSKQIQIYQQKNVDLVKSAANKTIKIEQAKYAALLKMQKQYMSGNAPSAAALGGNYSIGAVNSNANTTKSKAHDAWRKEMIAANDKYVTKMQDLAKKYNDALAKAKTAAEKDKINNQFIIDQLKLQEEMNKELIKLNDKAIAKAQEELKNKELTTDQQEQLNDAVEEYKQSSIDAQKSIKEAIRDRYEFEFSLIEELIEKGAKASEEMDYLLNLAELVGMGSAQKSPIFEAIMKSREDEYLNAKGALKKLMDEQKKFAENSYEWNILQEQIDDVTSSVRDLSLEMLEANKNRLGNQIDALLEESEKGMLDGKSLDDWKDYRDKWASGVEKEIELEKLRQRMLELEDKTLEKRLEALDRQEQVSKKDLEYLDKQLAVLELQDKLANIEKERDVQVIQKQEDGTWDWAYVRDQSEYDKTKEELNEANKDLEDFKNSIREDYVTDLQSVLDKAKEGEFSTSEELAEALANLRNVYGAVLGDIPDISYEDAESIIAAYEEYLQKNKDILNQTVGESSDADFALKLSQIGTQIEVSFRNIIKDLGKVISDSIKNALGLSATSSSDAKSMSYVIQTQNLEFPNVTDATGLEEAFRNLPQVAVQVTNSK